MNSPSVVSLHPSTRVTSEQQLIEVDHVSVIFGSGPQQVTALSDVTFHIAPNEFVSLLGPSGCGKSTLLRIVADLLQPTTGRVRIAGKEPKQARLQRQFGIVFQTPALFDWRTVRHNVELPLELLGTRRKECRRISSELLDMVGLTRFADHYPWQLSGGMQQRVSIARALALDPPLLLMDEPFSALDEFTKEKLQMELLEIKRSTGKTFLFVTHSIPEAVFLSDRIIVLSAHPGQVHSVHSVNLPAERENQLRETEPFYQMITTIRNCFHEERDATHVPSFT
ncbi:NitT/TauT family transport system ATP-binding protein [Paenibacillus polysaccharolyticus]|uniref:NitT/TauT family transport system ATP-binding protein n=1 Tax=Paenibacillus polysaccharolyticus TaxID=582692 RepID=A0A1G5K355_9BACL|nr:MULTISPECIES: ABC transporter ATP-binding protein [Paenibacillus]SCY95017.1 NitT/TauT family transport system ATP-binding protein [Paenibacillus polysaccharolyticus]